MSLEDELKLQEANQKISNLMTQLNETKEKVSDLMSERNDLKNKELMYSGEIRSLQAEMKYLEANKKNIDILNDRINYLEKERKNSEAQINNLEQKIDQKEKKIEDLSKDKEKLLQEKSEILEAKNEIIQKITEKELELKQKETALADLRDKYKKSNSDLLSKTMEIDKLLRAAKGVEENGKKLKNEAEKAKNDESKIKELETKIATLEKSLEEKGQGASNQLNEITAKLNEAEKKLSEKASGSENTGVFFNLDGILDFMKKSIPQGKSTVRIIVPSIQDLTKYKLVEALQQLPNNIVVNIAGSISDPFGDPLVRELKSKFQLTHFNDCKIIALNIDSVKCLIGLQKDNKIIGIYSNISEIIELFKPAIMEPFIRGRKL